MYVTQMSHIYQQNSARKTGGLEVNKHITATKHTWRAAETQHYLLRLWLILMFCAHFQNNAGFISFEILSFFLANKPWLETPHAKHLYVVTVPLVL